ncbi:MAG: dihydropteroate synthase, partial [Rhizobiales bacterium]|nr:dihydropteroate synthase [Hyphomicrobiales bacterium]
LNSVCGQEDRLEFLLPLARKHDVAVVALCHDGAGISENPGTRFAIAQMIVERAQDHGISTRDVIVDPLVLPQGAPGSAAAQLFPLVRRLAEELKVNTICGASNISFGHPDRAQRNAAFLRSAIKSGLTSAIMNPLSGAEMDVVRSTPKAGSARFPLDAKNS